VLIAVIKLNKVFREAITNMREFSQQKTSIKKTLMKIKTKHLRFRTSLRLILITLSLFAVCLPAGYRSNLMIAVHLNREANGSLLMESTSTVMAITSSILIS
jgi:hypothetical protein